MNIDEYLKWGWHKHNPFTGEHRTKLHMDYLNDIWNERESVDYFRKPLIDPIPIGALARTNPKILI